MNTDRFLSRGKRLDNGEWITGYYIGSVEFSNIRHILATGGMGASFKVDPSTLGQCTGLRDKNDTLIFEEDVIVDCDQLVSEHDFAARLPEYPLVVKFGEYKHLDAQRGYPNGDLGFYCESINAERRKLLRNDILFWVSECVVIGNIHDNPELVEVEGNA